MGGEYASGSMSITQSTPASKALAVGSVIEKPTLAAHSPTLPIPIFPVYQF